jgi:cytochrome c
MSTRNAAAFAAVLFAFASSTALAQQGPNLGQPITEADVGAWNLHAMADGSGLPTGSGTAEQGKVLFAQKCALCHGEGGKGATAAPLVGNPPIDGIDSPKTITNFWGYSTTVFDYVRRAMPWVQPRSLTNDEVYAIVAYIFAENKLIGANDVMNAQTLPKVKMPNAENFIIRFPDRL